MKTEKPRLKEEYDQLANGFICCLAAGVFFTISMIFALAKAGLQYLGLDF